MSPKERKPYYGGTWSFSPETAQPKRKGNNNLIEAPEAEKVSLGQKGSCEDKQPTKRKPFYGASYDDNS